MKKVPWLVPSRALALDWVLCVGAFYVACWLRHLTRKAAVKAYRQPAVLLKAEERLRKRTRILFAITAVLVLTALPLRIALWVSRPWLDRMAHHLWAEIPSSSPEPPGPMLSGLLVISDIRAGPGKVTFYLPGGARIAYSPDPPGERLTPAFEADLPAWWGE